MKGRYKMVEAVETMDGWYSLHDLRTMDWTSWKLTTSEARQEAITEFENLLDEWDAVEEREEGSHVMYNVIGQKADFMFMFLRPTMEELADLETAFNKTSVDTFIFPASTNLSVFEFYIFHPIKIE